MLTFAKPSRNGRAELQNLNMKTIEVVAAIVQHEGKILATQRATGEWAGLWEFPGGKIEKGETREAALVREIAEELQVDIRVGQAVCTTHHRYPHFQLTMHSFWCTLLQGTPQLTEHRALQWLAPHKLDTISWLPADVEVVGALKRQLWPQ